MSWKRNLLFFFVVVVFSCLLLYLGARFEPRHSIVIVGHIYPLVDIEAGFISLIKKFHRGLRREIEVSPKFTFVMPVLEKRIRCIDVKFPNVSVPFGVPRPSAVLRTVARCG
jgi:hypothetical protein